MIVDGFNGLQLNGTPLHYEVLLSGRLPYGLNPVQAQMLMRTGRWPRFAGLTRGQVVLGLDIYIRSGGTSEELAVYFNYEDEETAELSVVDDDGSSNPRFVACICVGLEEVPLSAGIHYKALLVVDGDPRWHKLASPVTWTSVGDGETNVLNNAGPDEAYPTQIQVFPTASKTGYAYRRWIRVQWGAENGYLQYPVDITNDSLATNALVTATKMQADGDDLRVWVDGVEVDRWLDGINTSTTKVWVNLDFEPYQVADLATAIAGAGTVAEIEVDDDISGFPDSGFLLIGSEIFTYTGKNNYEKTFTGCTRAQRGTSAAAHSVGADVEWIQHDVWILYGNASATAPVADDTYKPMFSLASSNNTSWVYTEFGENGTQRSGRWTWVPFSTSVKYTANRGTNASPYSEIGVQTTYFKGKWYIYNPMLISNINFTNGEKYITSALGGWQASIISSDDGETWDVEDTITIPSASFTWESWSDSEAIANRKFAGLSLGAVGGTPGSTAYLEAADCTVSLWDSPDITIGAEAANYDLDCTITNETTGEAIRLTFPFLTTSVNAVEVNTEEFIVFEYENDKLIFSALTLVGGPRKHWLRLAPGNNTIRYNEVGATNCVSLSWIWYERHVE